MNRIFRIVILVGFAIVIGAMTVLLLNQKDIAYFDYNDVYNNCSLKLKLEKDLISVGTKRKSELDSMQMELSFLSQKIGNENSNQVELDRFEEMKNRYLTFEQKYEEENLRLKETYFSQIRKEINDKAKLYAESKGLDYLFAAMGDGSLMYGAKSEDVTEDFKKYIDK